MNKMTMAATIFVALIVTTAAIWLVFNQMNSLSQTNKVQITAFIIDPEGWENPGGLLLTCSYNITLKNNGINEVQELRLNVKMFVNGREIDVENNVFGVDEGSTNDIFSPGEVRILQGELQYSLHSGGAIDTVGGHPVGASYMAQVLLGNEVLDEAKLTGLFSFELTATITLEKYGGYYGIAYDSVKGEIYLTNGDFHLVYVISDSTNDLVATIPVGTTPSGIAYDSGKGEIFVTNYGSDTVSVISDSDYSVVATIPVGRQPSALAYDSGKGEMYVGHAGCNQILVISDSTNAVVANITVENEPIRLVYDSGKGEIFVTNHGSDTASVISDSDYSVVATIPVGRQPNAMDYDSVNNNVFVANYNSNSISVISDSNYAVIADIPLERQPQAIGYDSGRGKIFVAYSESHRVSVISVTSMSQPLPSIPESP